MSRSNQPTVDRVIAIHGSPVSKYFNIVRAALCEERLPFEFISQRASQEEAFLAINQMGKIPILRIDGQHFAETVALLELLDDCFTTILLRPTEPHLAARMRQVINIVQVYIEVPIRSLFRGIFIGGKPDSDAISNARPVIERACGARAQLLRPSPYLQGNKIFQADLFAFFIFDVTRRAARFVYGDPLIDKIGWFGKWNEHMHLRPSIRTTLEEFQPLSKPIWSPNRHLTEKASFA